MLTKIDQLNAKAWDMRDHDFRSAHDLARAALDSAQLQHYQSGVAHAQLTLSYCYFKEADYPNALVSAGAALEQFELLQNSFGIQRTLNTLGMVYGQMGDLTSALKTFLKTYRLCQDLKDTEGEAKALNNLAVVYVFFGDYTTALDYYFKALGLARTINAKEDELKTLQNLGVVYFELGRYKDSLEYFNHCLKLLETSTDDHTRALTLMNLGRTHHKLGDNKLALDYQQSSLTLLQEQEDTSGISYTLDELGRTHLGLGDTRQAALYLWQSLDIKQTIGDVRGEAETRIHLGTLYTQRGNYDEAVDTLEHALQQAKKIDARAEIYRSHQGLAKALAAKGDFVSAFEHLESYIEIKEALFDDASDQRFQALRVGYEVEQAEKEKEIYRLKSVELAQANERLQNATAQLERQAREDPLTKLYNRRHFDVVLDTNYHYAKSFKLPMSVMICDIDNFKMVNDTFSHAVGDEVLIQVAQLFEAGVRGDDTVARYGGEEFVIHFPETAADTAYKICERLRLAIANHPWHSIHPDLKVTVSMGLCDATQLESGETMIARADDTLYEVKHNGKNQVRIWEEVPLELHRG